MCAPEVGAGEKIQGFGSRTSSTRPAIPGSASSRAVRIARALPGEARIASIVAPVMMMAGFHGSVSIAGADRRHPYSSRIAMKITLCRQPSPAPATAASIVARHAAEFPRSCESFQRSSAGAASIIPG